jgi:hypothetical protein
MNSKLLKDFEIEGLYKVEKLWNESIYYSGQKSHWFQHFSNQLSIQFKINSLFLKKANVAN